MATVLWCHVIANWKRVYASCLLTCINTESKQHAITSMPCPRGMKKAQHLRYQMEQTDLDKEEKVPQWQYWELFCKAEIEYSLKKKN